MNNKLMRILKYILGWPFSILALLFIIKIILPQATAIRENIQNPNYTLLILAVISFLLFYFFRSLVWHYLLKVYKGNIRFKTSASYWSSSELKRYIPGNIWGFLARTMKFSEIGITKKELAKLLLIEAGVFVVSAVVVSTLGLELARSILFPNLDVIYVQILRLLVVIGIISYLFNYKLHKLWKEFSINDNIQILSLACISTFFFGVGYYFAISSIAGLSVENFFQLSGLFILAFLVGALSLITPAGFGVREGFIVIALAPKLTAPIAGVVSLFSRLILIVSELIFVFIAYIVYKTKNQYVLRLEKWIGTHKTESVLIVLFLFFGVFFTQASFLRHDNFYTGKFDLGNMVQTVWNTTQGRIFEFTNPNGIQIVSRLAFHADFILILLAPFYTIFPTPKTLLFIQAWIVGSGAFFVYLIADKLSKNKYLALVLSFSFLINPSLQRSVLYDFHSVVLATTFLLAAYYFFIVKRFKLLILFLLLSVFTKEQIWLIAALFGAALFFYHKKRILGTLLFISCITIFYFLVSIAIPASLGNSHFALSYYSEFGDTPFEVIKNIIFSPGSVLNSIISPSKIDYLVQIFSPLGFLPLLSPITLVFAIPDLMKNLLSNNPQLHQIYYQYTAAITPFLYISSIYSLGKIQKLLGKKSEIFLILYVVLSSIIGAYKFGPLPGSKSPNIAMFTKINPDRVWIKEHLDNIPQDLSVAASNNIGAHLSHRRFLYVLPNGIDKADVITILLDDSGEENIRTEIVKKLKLDSRYKLEIEKNNFFVFIKK